MSPASAQAGMITKGGTATEPNGVPSARHAQRREAGRAHEHPLEAAGEQRHQRRDRQQEHRDARDDADPRRAVAHREKGDRQHRRERRDGRHRAQAHPDVEGGHGGQRERGEQPEQRQRRSASAAARRDAARAPPSPRIAATAIRCSSSWRRGSHSARSQPRYAEHGQPGADGEPLRERPRTRQGGASSSLVEALQGVLQLRAGLGDEPGNRGQRVGQSAKLRLAALRIAGSSSSSTTNSSPRSVAAGGEPHAVERDRADRCAAVERDRSLGPRAG